MTSPRTNIQRHALDRVAGAVIAAVRSDQRRLRYLNLGIAALSCTAACSSEHTEPGTTPAASSSSAPESTRSTQAMPAQATGTTSSGVQTPAAVGGSAPPAGGDRGAAAGAGGSAGSSGVIGTAAAVSGAGGSADSAAAGNAGSAAAGSMAMPAAGSGAQSTGSLPAIPDPTAMGPFAVKETDNVGPGMQYTTIEPAMLGQGGLKHPILIWGPGAGSTPAIYQTLLDHIASHGFVIVSYNSTPQGPELSKAIDWIVGESQREGSAYAGKLDTTRIAMGGQSAGSLATFQAGKDERLTTTVHINGGTFNHGDVANLIKPAFFACGDDPNVTGGDGTWESDLARPNCDADFMNAMVPVWYGVVIGSSHTTVIDNPLMDTDAKMLPLKQQYLGATVAWLRWQLAGDLMMKAQFVGPSCGYCTQSMLWKVQQKDLQ